jgi:hypothetical protein
MPAKTLLPRWQPAYICLLSLHVNKEAGTVPAIAHAPPAAHTACSNWLLVVHPPDRPAEAAAAAVATWQKDELRTRLQHAVQCVLLHKYSMLRTMQRCSVCCQTSTASKECTMST